MATSSTAPVPLETAQNFYDSPAAYQAELELMNKDEKYVPLVSLFSPAGTSTSAGALSFDRTKLNAKISAFGIVTGYSLPKPKTSSRASHNFSMTISVVDPTLNLLSAQGHHANSNSSCTLSARAVPLIIFFNSLDCQVLPLAIAHEQVGLTDDAVKPTPLLPRTSMSSFLPIAVGDVIHMHDVKVQEYKNLPQLVTMKGSTVSIRHYQCDHVSGVRKASLSLSQHDVQLKAFTRPSIAKTPAVIASESRKKGQSFEIQHHPAMHCIISVFRTNSDSEVVGSNESSMETQLSRYGQSVLIAESLSDSLLPHTDLHSILYWINRLKTTDTLTSQQQQQQQQQQRSHLVRVNGKSIAEILSDGNGVLNNMASKCDTVCLYTGYRLAKVGDLTLLYLRLWDGSTCGTTAVKDGLSVHLAVKYATMFAGTRDIEQLQATERQAIAQLLLDHASLSSYIHPPFSSSSSASSPSSPPNSSSVIMGEEVEVLVSDPQIVSILQHGLLRGTWLRIRNLHLTEVPSIHFDTHVCVLQPYCRDVSLLIQKYYARVAEERQRSAVQAQRERQFNALTHSSVGHPFTVLAVCQATPAPAKYCIRVRITGWWPRDIRKFLVHYDLDTYNRIIEPESAVRRPRGSGIFFVLKVQDERETGVHCDLMVSGADAEFFFSAISERNGLVASSSTTASQQQLAVSDAFLSLWVGDDVVVGGGCGSCSSSNDDRSASGTLLAAFEKRLQESVQSAEMLEMYVESYDSFEASTSDTAAGPIGDAQVGRGKKRNAHGIATTALQHVPEQSHVRRLRLFNTKIPTL